MSFPETGSFSMEKVPVRGEERRIKTAAMPSLVAVLTLLLAGTGCGGLFQGGSSNRSNHKSLSSLVISPPNAVVPIGDTERFAATGVFTDGSTQDMSEAVVWSVDNPAVATVSGSGLAVAKGQGTAEITATSGLESATAKLTVPAPTLISISISAATFSVSKGGIQQLTATGSFTDGTTKDLTATSTWASSAAGIAGVGNTGMVSGVAAGTTTITATSGKIIGAQQVTVVQAALVSLSVAPSAFSLAKGRTQQFTVTGKFADGTTQDETASVAWTVAPASVVSISNGGLATALATGTATLTAISGSISGSGTLIVTPATLASLAITPASPMVAKGSTQQLSVTGAFSDGSTQNITSTVAWTVAPANVASVSNAGLVSAIANGTATVTATSGSISGSDLITVSGANLTSIAITPPNPTLSNGATQQMTATGTYSDGSTQDITSKVSWSGAKAGVLNLNATGLVTAQGPGSASIAATSGSVSGSDTITVSPSLVSIAVTPTGASVPKGETQQMTATGTYNDGSTQDISNKVTWSGAVTGVVQLSTTGLVTAQGLGTATITATLGSISGATGMTVSAAVPVSIAVSPAGQTITAGAALQMHAVETLSDGTTRNITNTADWTSATPDIATVDASGLATSVAAGTATIDVSYRSISGSGTFTVIPVQYVVTESSTRQRALFDSYFANTRAPGIDADYRITYRGAKEDICAMVYVFAADQQMAECCGCKVSRNGLRTLSLNTDLTSNPLTGKIPASGSVQIIASDEASNPTCNPTSLTPSERLDIWATHIQALSSGLPAPSGQAMPLHEKPPTLVTSQCQAIQELGSGQGICSCGKGD